MPHNNGMSNKHNDSDATLLGALVGFFLLVALMAYLAVRRWCRDLTRGVRYAHPVK